MFLINNEEFTKLTQELEESIVKLEESKNQLKYDKNYIYLERFVLDRKIKIYQFIIDEALYLNDDIIRVLKRKLEYFKILQDDKHFFEINSDS